MKPALVIALAFALGACSEAEDRRARQEAHRTLDSAKKDAKKASEKLDKELHNAREKMRDALHEPKDSERR